MYHLSGKIVSCGWERDNYLMNPFWSLCFCAMQKYSKPGSYSRTVRLVVIVFFLGLHTIGFSQDPFVSTPVSLASCSSSAISSCVREIFTAESAPRHEQALSRQPEEWSLCRPPMQSPPAIRMRRIFFRSRAWPQSASQAWQAQDCMSRRADSPPARDDQYHIAEKR